MFCVSAAVCLLFLAAPAPEGLAGMPVRLPLGLADESRKVGYVPGAKGGIDALDLATGKLLWNTKEATKPLVVVNGLLLAERPIKDKPNCLQVVVLDVSRQGMKVLESHLIRFPEWVAVELAHGRTFASAGRIERGHLLLQWEACAFNDREPPPRLDLPAGQPQPDDGTRQASGVVRVNLETGRVRMLPTDRGPAWQLPKELENAFLPEYWTGMEGRRDPFVSGKVLAVLDHRGSANERQTMSLKRWDLATARPLPTVKLREGRQLRVQASVDGRHVFVRQSGEKVPDYSPIGKRLPWKPAGSWANSPTRPRAQWQ